MRIRVLILTLVLALLIIMANIAIAYESLLEDINSIIDSIESVEDTELTFLKEQAKSGILNALEKPGLSEQQKIQILNRVRDFLQTVQRVLSRDRLREALRVMLQVAEETGQSLDETCEQLRFRLRDGLSLDEAANAVREQIRSHTQLATQASGAAESDQTGYANQVKSQERNQVQAGHGGTN